MTTLILESIAKVSIYCGIASVNIDDIILMPFVGKQYDKTQLVVKKIFVNRNVVQ